MNKNSTSSALCLILLLAIGFVVNQNAPINIFSNLYILSFLRVILGLVLLSASVTKLGDFSKFTEIVSAYELLPRRAVTITSYLILLTECSVGICLLMGVRLPWAASTATGIFLLFTGAVTINILRGRKEIACGCFGASSEEHLTWLIVLRNVVLAGCAAFLAITQLGKSFWIFPITNGTLSRGETFATTSLAIATVSIWWLSRVLLKARWLLTSD
jgi:uncharacterized membrane protein YphA (DoxX/SURF4 family)